MNIKQIELNLLQFVSTVRSEFMTSWMETLKGVLFSVIVKMKVYWAIKEVHNNCPNNIFLRWFQMVITDIFLESKLGLLNLLDGDLTPPLRTYSKLIHTDDSIHSDHGYLDTWDNPLGPP